MKHLSLLFIILIFASTGIAQRSVGNVKIVDENGQNREVKLYEASYALVIGASAYNNGWQRLPGVRDDVAAVSKVLTKHNFTVETAIDPTSENLLSIINSFVNRYGLVINNRLLIYFAGHGYTETGDDGRKFGYIVPVDAPDPNKNRIGFQQKALTMDEIEMIARRIRSKHALFVFDSCFSGSLISRSKTVVPPYISYLTAQPVRQFITAGSDNQEVPDESIFRQMFVRGLEGEANSNKDDYITGTELAVYLQEQVIYYRGELQTPQYGKIRDPNLDRGDFVFTIPSPSESNNRIKAASLANQALTEIMRANFTEAERLANQALNLDDSSALAYGIRGWSYNYKNDYNSSKNDLEKAIRLDSNNPLFYARLANVYRSLNDNETARRIANEALQKLRNPGTAIEYYAKALSYGILGQLDEAVREYNKAIQEDTRFTIAYNGRGVSYDDKKEYDSAIRDYTKTIELNPKYFYAYINRGNSYFNMKEYDSAIRDYTKAIELDSRFVNAYSLRGNSYFNMKEYNLAIQDYTRYISTNPKNPNIYIHRADAYDKIGETAKAEADRRKYRELGGK